MNHPQIALLFEKKRSHKHMLNEDKPATIGE